MPKNSITFEAEAVPLSGSRAGKWQIVIQLPEYLTNLLALYRGTYTPIDTVFVDGGSALVVTIGQSVPLGEVRNG